MAKMTALQAQEIVARHEALIAGARETIEAKAGALTKEHIDAIMVTPPRQSDIYHRAETYRVAEVREVIITPGTIGFIAYGSMECDFEYESSDEFVSMDVILTGSIQDGQFIITRIFAEYTPDEACTNEGESIAEQEG